MQSLPRPAERDSVNNGIGLVTSVADVARIEHPAGYACMLTILAAAPVSARWRAAAIAKSEGTLRFEEVPPPAVQVFGPHWD